MAVYSDGGKKEVTSNAQLKSSNTLVAEASGKGAIKAKKAGTALISMTYTGVESDISLPAPIVVTVKAPVTEDVFTRLTWKLSASTEGELYLPVGAKAQVQVMGETTDGRTVDLTKRCKIESRDSSVVSIDGSGNITALKAGSTYLYITSAPNTNLELPSPLIVSVF